MSLKDGKQSPEDEDIIDLTIAKDPAFNEFMDAFDWFLGNLHKTSWRERLPKHQQRLAAKQFIFTKQFWKEKL